MAGSGTDSRARLSVVQPWLRVAAFLGFLGAVMLVAAPLAAQAISGTLVEAETGAPPWRVGWSYASTTCKVISCSSRRRVLLRNSDSRTRIRGKTPSWNLRSASGQGARQASVVPASGSFGRAEVVCGPPPPV